MRERRYLGTQCTAASSFGFGTASLLFVFSGQALNLGVLAAEESFVVLLAGLKFIAYRLNFRTKSVEFLVRIGRIRILPATKILTLRPNQYPLSRHGNSPSLPSHLGYRKGASPSARSLHREPFSPYPRAFYSRPITRYSISHALIFAAQVTTDDNPP